MKNIVLILSFILSIAFHFECARAQSNSDGVKLNIILHPVQTITINSSQENANLEYLTKEDYKTGVVATYDDHLTVTSSGGFQVNVASSKENLTHPNSTVSIPVSDISISAITGTDNNMINIFDNVILSTKPESLIRSGTGGRNIKYSITYDNSAGSADKYLNKNPGTEEIVFTTEITYTITSK